MFEFFKRLFGAKKRIKNAVGEYLEKQKRYISMSKEELAALPEEELYDAALARVFKITDEYEDVMEGALALNDEMRAFFVTAYYEMEVCNGGLCQFFVNSSRHLAPILASSLGKIGAEEHKKAFENFAYENNIDLTDLSSFEAEDIDEYEERAKRYPFDDFDKVFYEMKAISDYLTLYVKENVLKF